VAILCTENSVSNSQRINATVVDEYILKFELSCQTVVTPTQVACMVSVKDRRHVVRKCFQCDYMKS